MGMKTFSFRIKDATTCKHLKRLAGSVNFVWNYCNETSRFAITNRGKWLTEFDLNKLTAGSSKLLGLHADSVNSICREYTKARRQFKRIKLRWRSRKASLGWVPFKRRSVKVKGDTVSYLGLELRFWKSREIEGALKEGSFSQDARGRWYVNFQCEVQESEPCGTAEIGVDLGCKDVVVCSSGRKFTRENLTRRYQERLAKAQRARKPKLVRTIHARIRNSRKDFAHKTTTELCRTSKVIVVGDIESRKLAKTRMAKSINDAGHSQIKTMLRYKAIRHGVVYREVSERSSTVTCSVCSEKSGPSGQSALGVREWRCQHCDSLHDRDVNAARNILRWGRPAPFGNPPPLSEPLRRA